MSVPLLRRTAVAAVSLALLAVPVPASAATAPPRAAGIDYHHRAGLAARWQVSQLTAGHIHNGQYNFNDWGLTVDTGLMLAADGNHPAALHRLKGAVRRHYTDYTSPSRGRSAGAIAKTLLFIRAIRADTKNFGGVDVRAQLLHLKVNSGPDRGRFSDSATSDYSNVLGQSYAVIGLARTGGVPQSAVDFLLHQRCVAGFFRLDPVTGKTCHQSHSAPDIDATALAIQALLSARQHGATVPKGIIAESATWLVHAQRRNGSFGGGLTTEASNSNSTGLAANALAATGHRSARLQAARWVSRLQITRARAGNGPARTEIGAIAYRRAALQRALKHGIGTQKRDQFRRATPQAYYAFAPAPFTTLVAPR